VKDECECGARADLRAATGHQPLGCGHLCSLGGELGKICRRLEIVGSQRCALSIGSGLLHGLRLSPISVSFFKRWQPDLG
jgi:hypothetical protein